MMQYLFPFSWKSQGRGDSAAPASAEGDLVGRGRQKGVPGPFSAEGTVSHDMFQMIMAILLKVCMEIQLQILIDGKVHYLCDWVSG